jgi:hypothetical protein
MNGRRRLRIRIDRGDIIVMTFLSATTIVAWIYFPHQVLADVAISAALLIAFIRCWL